MSDFNRNRVFVSYSHKDKEWLDRLRDIIAPDIRNERIDYWDDRDLQPGDPWYDRILEAISHARVAVLLVSPNFLASHFIMEEELPHIITASNNGLTVIWIPLFGTFYGPDAPPEVKQFTHIQAACDAGKPLADLDQSSQTATLLDVCRQMQRLLNPGRIPWNLPFSSLAELFKGRDKILAQLELNLQQHGSAAIVQPQVIHGLGGIGKTRLAIEYAWRHQNDFTAFLFVSGNKPEDLDRNLAALCASDCLDLPEQKSQNQDEQRDSVIRWLQQNKGWLLILDNVDTDEGVQAAKILVAKLRGGHVLITSRVTSWGRGMRTLALDVLSTKDAVAILLESTISWRAPNPEDVAQAGILAENLGCLPLALTHATAYMQHHYMGFSDYIKDFECHFERLLDYHDHLAIEYETELEKEGNQSSSQEDKTARKRLLKTVSTTFFLSFDRLAPEAKAILQSAAFLSPDPIPVVMFEQCLDETSILVDLWCNETNEAKTGKTVADALAELSRYSLISRSEGLFHVHRMEQRILRSRVGKENIPKWHESTQNLLFKYAPEETAESPRTWAIWNVIRPHAEFLVESFVADEGLPPHLDLMGSLGSFLFGKKLYSLSLALEISSLKIAERISGYESKDMADKLINYGESLRVLDRAEEALEAFQKSLEIRKKLDGDASLRVAIALNYIGLAHDNLADSKAAETCYRSAISIHESQSKDVDKSAFAKTLNNLGSLVRDAGKLDEAESLLSKAVELTVDDEKEKVKPQLAIICRVQLAGVLRDKSELDRADIVFQDALKYLSFFPEEDPFRESVLEQYAIFLCEIHKLSEAKHRYFNAFTIYRPTWGSDEYKKQPERRLRGKMRIIETTAKIISTTTHLGPAPRDVTSELEATEWKPWNPFSMYGITIKDSQELAFDFLFKNGDEEILTQKKQYEYQKLIHFFLTSIAVDEANQWVTADGLMPQELRDSSLGLELVNQAHILGQFLVWTMDSSTPSGKAFRIELTETAGNSWKISQEYILELWIKPTGARVYTGKPVGDLARFGSKGEVTVTLLDSSLKTVWEWRKVSPQPDSKINDKLNESLTRAFKAHVLPVINRSLNEGRLFARLRQINNCLFLALWFKEKYRHHPNVAKFLESGNPKQLVPTIHTISSLSEKQEEGVGQVAATIIEVSEWGRGIDLNNKAIEMRKKGQIDEAVRLHREALKFDEELRGENDPKIPHRLNNLSIALIMQGQINEAKPLLERAWLLKSGSHDLTSIRLLLIRICVALLEAQPVETLIGQLKMLISQETLSDFADVNKTWDIADFIGYMYMKLPSNFGDFISAVSAALNDRSRLSALDQFELWRDTDPLPVDGV